MIRESFGEPAHEHADAGAIDQDVGPAAGIDDGLHGIAAGVRLGDVGDEFDEPAAEHRLGGELIEAAAATSTAAILAPAAASARAITRPMPFAAPVIIAVRPASGA